jgi:hypothetical protein
LPSPQKLRRSQPSGGGGGEGGGAGGGGGDEGAASGVAANGGGGGGAANGGGGGVWARDYLVKFVGVGVVGRIAAVALLVCAIVLAMQQLTARMHWLRPTHAEKNKKKTNSAVETERHAMGHKKDTAAPVGEADSLELQKETHGDTLGGLAPNLKNMLRTSGTGVVGGGGAGRAGAAGESKMAAAGEAVARGGVARGGVARGDTRELQKPVPREGEKEQAVADSKVATDSKVAREAQAPGGASEVEAPGGGSKLKVHAAAAAASFDCWLFCLRRKRRTWRTRCSVA